MYIVQTAECGGPGGKNRKKLTSTLLRYFADLIEIQIYSTRYRSPVGHPHMKILSRAHALLIIVQSKNSSESACTCGHLRMTQYLLNMYINGLTVVV